MWKGQSQNDAPLSLKISFKWGGPTEEAIGKKIDKKVKKKKSYNYLKEIISRSASGICTFYFPPDRIFFGKTVWATKKKKQKGFEKITNYTLPAFNDGRRPWKTEQFPCFNN